MNDNEPMRWKIDSLSKPKVIVDGIVFENRNQIGIWRVFYEVMNRLATQVEFTLLLNRPAAQPLPAGVRTIPWVQRGYIRRSHVLRRVRRMLVFKRFEREYPNAIWHSTFFSPDPRSKKCSVVSVYDMVAERHFWASSELVPQIEPKSLAFDEADAILAISNTTADELSRFRPDLRERIFVAALGAEHLTFGQARKKKSAERFCLFVGARNSYKNFVTLVEAVASPEWPQGVGVRVVGKEFSNNEQQLLRYFGVQASFQNLGSVNDEDLASLYQDAACFVFPSLGEGFGLPTIEAQLNDCVPVVSDLHIFREVAGDGAVFFDPRSPQSFAFAVRGAVSDAVREEMVQKCRANSQRFSWDDTAAATLECYKRVWERRHPNV